MSAFKCNLFCCPPSGQKTFGHVTIGLCSGSVQLSRASLAFEVSEAPRSPVQVCLYLSPVTPPVSLLHSDSLVMDFRLLPEKDLLELRPLEGTVRQLPSLVLKAHTAALITAVRARHPREHGAQRCNSLGSGVVLLVFQQQYTVLSYSKAFRPAIMLPLDD